MTKKSSRPKIFRITIEVSGLDQAAAFYAKLLDDPGKRHPGARHYFDCGGVVLALEDPESRMSRLAKADLLHGELTSIDDTLERVQAVTPDDVQIGVSFDSYRGQPDLLDHAKSTVAILRGVKEFELRGGEMPKGLLLSGGPGTGKTFLASVIAAEAKLPFVYLDASSLQGAFVGTS